jgi:ubiquinone/menaquinone biosynthesis C-methylase UbiE
MNTEAAQDYNSCASDVFAPLYPYYAKAIVTKTGIHSGYCLDVGCGGGHLGLALRQIADLDLFLLDRSPEMLKMAEKNSHHKEAPSSLRFILAEVQAIPLRDACMDLVVSRGSMPFWKDLPSAFREICRILRPHGSACIFGGLGPPEMRKAIEQQMRLRNPDWQTGRGRGIPQRQAGEYDQALRLAGVNKFSVSRNDTGMWIEFSK